jgi:hypothetical protein
VQVLCWRSTPPLASSSQGYPDPGDNTWEPKSHILDKSLITDWQERCAKRMPEVWEGNDDEFYVEPVPLATTPDAALQLAKDAVREMGIEGSKADLLEKELAAEAQVRGCSEVMDMAL